MSLAEGQSDGEYCDRAHVSLSTSFARTMKRTRYGTNKRRVCKQSPSDHTRYMSSGFQHVFYDSTRQSLVDAVSGEIRSMRVTKKKEGMVTATDFSNPSQVVLSSSTGSAAVGRGGRDAKDATCAAFLYGADRLAVVVAVSSMRVLWHAELQHELASTAGAGSSHAALYASSSSGILSLAVVTSPSEIIVLGPDNRRDVIVVPKALGAVQKLTSLTCSNGTSVLVAVTPQALLIISSPEENVPAAIVATHKVPASVHKLPLLTVCTRKSLVALCFSASASSKSPSVLMAEISEPQSIRLGAVTDVTSIPNAAKTSNVIASLVDEGGALFLCVAAVMAADTQKLSFCSVNGVDVYELPSAELRGRTVVQMLSSTSPSSAEHVWLATDSKKPLAGFASVRPFAATDKQTVVPSQADVDRFVWELKDSQHATSDLGIRDEAADEPGVVDVSAASHSGAQDVATYVYIMPTESRDSVQPRGFLMQGPFSMHSRFMRRGTKLFVAGATEWLHSVAAQNAESTDSFVWSLRLHPVILRSALRQLSGGSLVALFHAAVKQLDAAPCPVRVAANAIDISVHIATLHRQLGVTLRKADVARLYSVLRALRATGHTVTKVSQRLSSVLAFCEVQTSLQRPSSWKASEASHPYLSKYDATPTLLAAVSGTSSSSSSSAPEPTAAVAKAMELLGRFAGKTGPKSLLQLDGHGAKFTGRDEGLDAYESSML